MDSPPQGFAEVIIVPVLCIFFAAAIWFAAWSRERTYGEKPKWRWLAMAPLLLGAFVGWKYFYPLVDPDTSPIWEQAIPFIGRRRIIYGSYGAFLAPVFFMLVLIVWAILDRKSKNRSSY